MRAVDSPAGRVLEAVRAWLAGEPGAEAVPDEVRALAELHGVAGILGLGELQRGNSGGVAARCYFANSIAYERNNRVLARVVDVARDEGIPVALVKGPALIAQAYGDGGVRGFGDIDLLLPDREAALLLAARLGGSVFDKGRADFVSVLRNPGKMAVVVDGCEIEMLYPIDEPSDGMLELLGNHRDMLRVPSSVEELCDPEPSLHLVFLLLHMLSNHFCGRLVWFVDIVVFVRAQGARVDWGFVERGLSRLGMTAAAEAVFSFCEHHLDGSMTRRLPGAGARYPGFLAWITDPRVVMSRSMGVQYVEGVRRWAIQFVYIGAYFLLSDRGTPVALTYTVARVRLPISRIVSLPRWFVVPPAWVSARAAAWITEHGLLKILGTESEGGQRCALVS